jgi:hypothetical protein
VFTPRRWLNANAYVEALRRIIEEEFFGLEGYSGLEAFSSSSRSTSITSASCDRTSIR